MVFDRYGTFLQKHAKKAMIVPIALIILATVFVLMTKINTGEIIQKDVSLSGGITITLNTENPIDKDELQTTLQQHFSEVVVRGLSEFGTDREIGVVIETASSDEAKLRSTIEETTNIKITEENASIEIVGPSIGESFYQQMLRALIFAFAFMAVAVLVTFRKLLPSFAVVIVAFGDLAITVWILNMLNVKISSAGIAALLLLIGYSIDTDMLLTTRILKKREGTILEGVISSVKTGMTMTLTTLAAISVAYFISTSIILKQMFLIILIGLVVDIILTYLLNAPMLMLYAEKKGGSN